MILRCKIDDLMLPAIPYPGAKVLIAFDGDESFEMEAVEALFYELVEATSEEALWLERAGYRLLARANDFEIVEI